MEISNLNSRQKSANIISLLQWVSNFWLLFISRKRFFMFIPFYVFILRSTFQLWLQTTGVEHKLCSFNSHSSHSVCFVLKFICINFVAKNLHSKTSLSFSSWKKAELRGLKSQSREKRNKVEKEFSAFVLKGKKNFVKLTEPPVNHLSTVERRKRQSIKLNRSERVKVK